MTPYYKIKPVNKVVTGRTITTIVGDYNSVITFVCLQTDKNRTIETKRGSSHSCDTIKFKDELGYDNGHLAPSRAFRYSEEAQYDSNCYSNIVNQNPNLNRGLWKSIEQSSLAVIDSSVVITGAIYRDTFSMIPDSLWKMVINKTDTILWIVPNKTCYFCYQGEFICDYRLINGIEIKIR